MSKEAEFAFITKNPSQFESIYRSPSQNNDEFDLFLSKYGKLLIGMKNCKSH